MKLLITATLLTALFATGATAQTMRGMGGARADGTVLRRGVSTTASGNPEGFRLGVQTSAGGNPEGIRRRAGGEPGAGLGIGGHARPGRGVATTAGGNPEGVRRRHR